MDIKQFRTDLDKAKKGVWVDVDPDGSVRVRVARLGNPAYQACLAELMGVTGRRISGSTIRRTQDPELRTRAMKKAMARHVLLDWEGFTSDGEVIPYSQQKAEELLEDPAYQDFYELILQFASDEALFREEAEEEDAGNLSSA